MHNIPCVILAGGKSSRMGEDKSLLPFGTYPTLTQYQYEKLSKIFSEVYISTKEEKFSFIDNSNIILDQNKSISSPMIALESIFEYLQTKEVFIVTVDVPLLFESTINELINKSNNYDITIAKDDERTHNLCGVFSKNILPLVRELIKKDIHKINYMIKQTSKHQIINFENKEQFLNINTQIEYGKALNTSFS